VTELCGFEGTISPTVNDYPHYPFFGFDSSTAPSVPIPETLLEFKENWSAYWRLWATWSNVAAYLRRLSDVLYYLSRFLLLALPIFVLFVLLSRRILQTENNDYGKESKSVKAFKRLSDVTYRPVKAFVSSMIEFLKAHSVYPKIWLALWFFYFNAFTIVIEFIAYYLCFIISFDVVSLYRQFYKLFLDLWTVFEFIPVWVWVIIGIIVLDIISRKQAYATLSHRERRNCGFINERGVVTTVYGVMGVGKTKLITDMGLSKEKLLRDQAFEIILECDFKFPYFPWINLENELKKATEYHVCFSVPSVRKWVNKKYRRWQKSPTSSRMTTN
jgi:hypothetical protein